MLSFWRAPTLKIWILKFSIFLRNFKCIILGNFKGYPYRCKLVTSSFLRDGTERANCVRTVRAVYFWTVRPCWDDEKCGHGVEWRQWAQRCPPPLLDWGSRKTTKQKIEFIVFSTNNKLIIKTAERFRKFAQR